MRRFVNQRLQISSEDYREVRMGRPKGSPTVPSFTKPGPKPKEAIAKVLTTIGRPPGLASRMKELQARIMLSDKPERILERMMDIALDDTHPKQVEMMIILAKRYIPETDFSGGEEKIPKSLTVEISDVDGKKTTVTVGNKATPEENDFIEMGDVEEVPRETED
jgi:hypothetical protein